MEIKLKVKGMRCEGCENRIKNSLEMLDEVKEVNANHNTGEVLIKLSQDVNIDKIKELIIDLGFEVEE